MDAKPGWFTPLFILLLAALSLTGCGRPSQKPVSTDSTPAAANPSSPEPQTTPPPERVSGDISYAFEPPPEWRNQFGHYRSPLTFYDGTPVVNANDWTRRRAEIRRHWDEAMGPWPALDAQPAFDIIETKVLDGVTEKKIRIIIPPRQFAYGYLFTPTSAGRHPAVLVLSADTESPNSGARPFSEVAPELARRGFVTLLMGPPGGNPRKPEMTDVECQPLSFLASIGATCANLLANLPEVDAAKIGVVGHAYGGKWAMFSSCLCDRFACAVWSEAGIVFDDRKASANYFEPWYLGREVAPRRTAVRREDERRRGGAYGALHDAGLNLQELHALMAPRPFLVSAGSNRRPSLALTCADDETRWTVLNHTIAVNRLLGAENRVAMTNRPSHELTPESKAQIYAFLERFLR